MDKHTRHGFSLPDAVMSWTTAGALVLFGVLFFDDAVIMGRTILALGLISAANELLKLRTARSGIDYGRLRLALAFTYLVLVVIGFASPPRAIP